MAKQKVKPNESNSANDGADSPKKRRVVAIGSASGAAVIVIAAVVFFIARSAGKDPITFDYASLPMLGNAGAPVKIVEFADFKCPACKYFHDNVFPLLKSNYIDPGVVRFYFMNFPFLGPDSTTAAIAGESIFHQKPSAFWNYYNAMYANQGNERTEWASPNFILRLATHFVPGIDYTRLGQEITEGKYHNQVEQQYATGQRIGVNSTPTLFINGHEFLDFSSWPALQAAIAKYK